MENWNISQLFLNAAKKYPERIAIKEINNKISYAKLAEDVISTAAYFKNKGIKSGDRVLIFVPMSIDLYRNVLALFYIGATAVFLDEWVSKSRLNLCCEMAQCKGFIGVFKAQVFAFFSKELRNIPIHLKLKTPKQGEVEMSKVMGDTPALITFTTGSTGKPKAALRSHGFLKNQFDALIQEIDPKPEDVDLPVLPILLFVNLGVGSTSVIAPFKMSKPEAIKSSLIIAQMEKQKVNRITASPFFIRKISEQLNVDKTELNGVAKIFTGGAPVFPAEAKIYKKAFPNCKFTIAYGSTEVEPISSINVDELLKKQTSSLKGLAVGPVFPKCALKIIPIHYDQGHKPTPKDFENLALADQQIGEIIVSGSHVLDRYFNSPKAFEKNKILVEGVIWHRTGDSGYLAENEIYLTGRCQQLIFRGEWISPFFVENLLLQVPGITIGTLLELEKNLLLVVEGEAEEEHLRETLPNIKFDRLVKVDKIPRDPRHHSKIDYPQLIAKF